LRGKEYKECDNATNGIARVVGYEQNPYAIDGYRKTDESLSVGKNH
jgi:hypothetical protein